ncbi:MAG: MFS transporter [Chlamydiota bacterium]
MENQKRFYSLHSKCKASLYTAFFIVFVDLFGWAIVFPLFAPLILNLDYGMFPPTTALKVRNMAIAGVFSAYPLTQFFGAPFFGGLADRNGRKKAFLLAIGGVSIGYFLSATALVFKSYIGLLIARLITGFFSGSLNIAFATISDLSTTAKDLTRNFSLVAIFGGLAWVLAALVGGDFSDPRLARYLQPATPFWITGIMTAIVFFIVMAVFRETCTTVKETSLSLFQGFKDLKVAFVIPKIKSLFTAYLLWSIGWVMILAWFAALSIEKFNFSQEAISYILMGNGLVWMAMNLIVYHVLASRFSLRSLALTGYLCGGLSLLIAIFGNQVVYTVFFLFAIAFSAILWGTVLSLISLSAPKELQGISLGVGQSVFSLGIILGPLLAGYLAGIRVSFPYYAAAALFLAGFILVALRRLDIQQKPQQQ